MNEDKKAAGSKLPDHEFYHKRHKMHLAFIFGLFLLLVSACAALAYQYSQQEIARCNSAGGNGICFDLENVADNGRFNVKNLPKDKKYRFVLKRKINDSEVVEVGSMLVDMGEAAKVVNKEKCLDYRQSTDVANPVCCSGSKNKPDRDQSGVTVCCKDDECAINSACVGNGKVVGSMGCRNGSWVQAAAATN